MRNQLLTRFFSHSFSLALSLSLPLSVIYCLVRLSHRSGHTLAQHRTKHTRCWAHFALLPPFNRVYHPSADDHDNQPVPTVHRKGVERGRETREG
uniref:Putative secreted protein n=1 Tax=Anopheles triannulatus TaxID=58253 RepID=A0A2M4B5M1_9DIPT